MKKVIDEVLVNACDHFYKKYNSDNSVSYIKVNYDNNKNIILCKNDGVGIPVTKEWDGCKTTDMYLPNALISQENTSSNYNDNENDKITGGLNGLGLS